MCGDDASVGMGGEDELLVGEVLRNNGGDLVAHLLARERLMRQPEGDGHNFNGDDADLIVWIRRFNPGG